METKKVHTSGPLPEIRKKFPAFVLAPQCAQGENWSDPELNEIGPPLQLALDVLARRKRLFH